MIVPSESPNLRRVRVANRELLTRGLKRGIWSDNNHRAMTMSWRAFFASAAGVFLAFNAVFALLYFAGNDPIANAPPGNFAYLLYFSIETLATVGYGDMHPQTHWGHVVATLEIFTGLSFLAVYTGLMFARFSRPQARFIFARTAVVAEEGGRRTLMIRVANERQNTISGAAARLWVVRTERSPDGSESRRFFELKLVRSENPVFALSWTLFHVLDDDSPLKGETAESLAAAEASLILTLTGLDDATGHFLHARHGYPSESILWNHRYVDMLERTPAGQVLIDYRRIHDVVAS
jgi:inward rectifier potassium channel